MRQPTYHPPTQFFFNYYYLNPLIKPYIIDFSKISFKFISNKQISHLIKSIYSYILKVLFMYISYSKD